jgi:hypothetical protein
MVVPAFAQSDNFPDVPDNHWAYDALKQLKAAGIIVGYPDGLVRGARGASRYEMAVAINAAFSKLKGITDGLDGQIKAINDKLNGYASASDLQNLRDALTALQNDVNAMKGWGEDIANLKRLADTFQKELQSLGVDVEAMKKDLGDIAARLSALEKRKPAVDISGDVNFWLEGGNSRDDHYGLDKDGRINGTFNPAQPLTGGHAGITDDLTILHEAAFKFAGTNETGPKWAGTLVVGNMLGGAPFQGFGSQSQTSFGFGYGEGNEDVYIQDFGVKFDTSIAGLAFNATVGRVGYKISPYILQRIDNTSYFSNDRWDNGKYYFDGGIIGFNFGGAKIDVIAGEAPGASLGRNQGASVNGTPLDPILSGGINGSFVPGGVRFQADRQLGANLNVPLTSSGNLNLAYLWLDTDTVNNGGGAAAGLGANRLNVFGGTVDFNFGKLKLEGGFAETDLSYNTSNILTTDNTAWNAKLMYGSDKWGIWGNYREVEADFLAPGDWGQLGVMHNPVNIKGFQVGGHLDLTHAVTLKASGEFDKGKDDKFGITTGFDTNTKINKWAVDLGYKVNSNLSFNVGYEDTKFDNLVTPGGRLTNFNANEPDYAWTTFGINYGLSEAAKLTIQYQLSDVKNDYQVTDGGTFKGGLLTTQLSVKF